jgi:Cu2+-containing amine oxidase
MVTTPFVNAQPRYGTLVDTRTYAPFHQHFLSARLDLDIDAETNTVYATECKALPVGPENPTASRSSRRRHRCEPRPRADRTTTGKPNVPGRWSTKA